jgi:RNA polymerase sigma-70 factor (ECF subfamily)
MPEQQQNEHPSSGSSGNPCGNQAVSLAREAVSGNPGAFNRLIELYYDSIFRMVYYRVRYKMDAEDLAQDIFTQAFKNIGKLRDVEKLRSWLFSIAINRIRDFKRKKQIVSFFGILSGEKIENEEEPDAEQCGRPDANPHYNLMRQRFWKQFDDLLGRLSNLEKEVFLLRFLDHLEINEIASVLVKNESTVKTHLYRALDKFKNDESVKRILEESLP